MQMMHFLIKNVLIRIYFENSNLKKNPCFILSTHLLFITPLKRPSEYKSE